MTFKGFGPAKAALYNHRVAASHTAKQNHCVNVRCLFHQDVSKFLTSPTEVTNMLNGAPWSSRIPQKLEDCGF